MKPCRPIIASGGPKHNNLLQFRPHVSIALSPVLRLVNGPSAKTDWRSRHLVACTNNDPGARTRTSTPSTDAAQTNGAGDKPAPSSNNQEDASGAQPTDKPASSKSIPAVPPPRPQPTFPRPSSGGGAGALASVDPDSLPDGFKGRRLWCFVGLVAAYMGMYFTRGTLTYCAPSMVADPAMNMTLQDIGAMTSAFPFAYGISKFIGGVMGAKVSPTLMLVGGLAVTAVLNLCTTAPGIGVMGITALWAANGCMQGIGAPASAALLTRWFASRERGTYWGMWNSGANIGGFLTPLVVGSVAKQFGWRYGMAIPALAALVVAAITSRAIKDSPAAAGYGGREEGEAAAATPAKPEPAKSQVWAALKQVLVNPGIWLLALTYFFVYVVRQGATSWLVFYLMATKGAADPAAAARAVSGLELGGLLGGSLAGILSDVMIRSAKSESAGHVGRRVKIVMGYLLATFGVLVALRAVPAEAKLLQWLTIGALGFCIYGPQMLIGLCGAELVEKPAVGASQGLLGLISYMGAANAGIPLSWIVTKYGWDGYFTAMGGSVAIALCLLLPLANAKSQLQLRAAGAH